MRALFLISGSGRTLDNIYKCMKDGKLDLEICGVVTSIEGVEGIKKAEKYRLKTFSVPRKKFKSTEEFSAEINNIVNELKPDLVLMGGFLHLWLFPERYKNRVLNIHPALLPKFGGENYYGIKVHKAVLKSGAKISGCTVHYADYSYDHGEIILQRKVPVYPDDTPETLAERVFKEECIAYPMAIKIVCEKIKNESEIESKKKNYT